MKNKEGYPDPTAGWAIANVRRGEKRRKRKEEHREHEQSTEKKARSDAEGQAKA